MNKTRILIVCIAAVVLIFISMIPKTFLSNILDGRVHFYDQSIGKALIMEDGQEFVVFRRLKIDNPSNNTDGIAVFKVRFKFRSLKPAMNKKLSMIPVPFLIGMKGFQEKYWMYNEKTGYFQGIYQWESKESAEKYLDSFIYKLMTKRSAPGTLSNEIIPGISSSKYIETLSSE